MFAKLFFFLNYKPEYDIHIYVYICIFWINISKFCYIDVIFTYYRFFFEDRLNWFIDSEYSFRSLNQKTSLDFSCQAYLRLGAETRRFWQVRYQLMSDNFFPKSCGGSSSSSSSSTRSIIEARVYRVVAYARTHAIDKPVAGSPRTKRSGRGGYSWRREARGRARCGGVQETRARIELSEFHVPCHCFLVSSSLFSHTHIHHTYPAKPWILQWIFFYLTFHAFSNFCFI